MSSSDMRNRTGAYHWSASLRQEDVDKMMQNMSREEIYESLVNDTPLHDVRPFSISHEDVQKDLQRREDERLNAPVVCGHLHFMIGLPRSGKSTWATRWMRSTSRKTSDGTPFPRAVVCADNIRLAMTGQRFNSHAEPAIHMVKDYMIVSLLQRGHDVLVDGTHTTKPSIKRLLQIDPGASWTHVATPAEVCKERAAKSGQSDLNPIIDKMGKQLQRLIDAGLSQVCEELRQEVKGYGEHRIA